jgi:hypothetical protein
VRVVVHHAPGQRRPVAPDPDRERAPEGADVPLEGPEFLAAERRDVERREPRQPAVALGRGSAGGAARGYGSVTPAVRRWSRATAAATASAAGSDWGAGWSPGRNRNSAATRPANGTVSSPAGVASSGAVGKPRAVRNRTSSSSHRTASDASAAA